MSTWLSRSEEDTFQFGSRIGKNAKTGDILLLYGNLGSGKTVLTKGIAQGAGVTAMVTSPTFTLMNQYAGKFPVYHFDIYRLNDPEELYDLDYEEYLYGDGIAIVEWPERMMDLLPREYLKVTLEKTELELQRKIILEPIGSRYTELEEVLAQDESIGD
jgi:tRNA threonylcarbamoyladenosine biosynthesis protein TsaE